MERARNTRRPGKERNEPVKHPWINRHQRRGQKQSSKKQGYADNTQQENAHREGRGRRRQVPHYDLALRHRSPFSRLDLTVRPPAAHQPPNRKPQPPPTAEPAADAPNLAPGRGPTPTEKSGHIQVRHHDRFSTRSSNSSGWHPAKMTIACSLVRAWISATVQPPGGLSGQRPVTTYQNVFSFPAINRSQPCPLRSTLDRVRSLRSSYVRAQAPRQCSHSLVPPPCCCDGRQTRWIAAGIADRAGRRSQRPMGGVRRRGLQGQADRLGDLVIADPARRAIAWPVRCARASDSSSRRSGAVGSTATAALPVASPHRPISESRKFAGKDNRAGCIHIHTRSLL